MSKIIRSTCGLCVISCGVLIHLDDGRPVAIEGDPDSPVNKGRLCSKGLASLEYLYHTDRLKHPLKRVGQRGEGKWQQITWDEALNLIAAELTKARETYGAESVAVIEGAAKGLQDGYLARLASAFGTPNIARQGHVCHVPRVLASKITHGFFPVQDLEYPPACLIVWGSDPSKTGFIQYERIIQALDRGTKLIVVDPLKIELAKRADLWLQLRPGSDLALALGMMNVIVTEALCDTDFVENWTVGFDKLEAHLRDYPLEKIEEITWVSADAIKEAARLYARNEPACIQWGNAFDYNVNSFQTARAISILRAITGNLSIPGGELEDPPLPLAGRRSPELELHNKLPESTLQRRVGATVNLIPLFRDVLPQSIIKAILEQDPYPIQIAYIQGCNPLLTYSNAKETHRALTKLAFLAVADMFMTPTAALADIVLPVACYLEFDSIAGIGTGIGSVVQVQQKVAQIGECRSDYAIVSDLARNLGLGEYFWDSEEQCLDAILESVGLTFSEFRKVGMISGTKRYRGHETNGFETPSRKVELYSSQLREWGQAPLPTYHELPETPYTDPQLAKEYPLIFTSWKTGAFRHSGGRQIATLRGSHPEPVILIHPETATRLRIREGDWVFIETKRGRIKQKATLTTSVDRRVVGADYAWWFPEKGVTDLYDWAESNINILTDNRPPFNPEIGSTNLRSIHCKVYRAL